MIGIKLDLADKTHLFQVRHHKIGGFNSYKVGFYNINNELEETSNILRYITLK